MDGRKWVSGSTPYLVPRRPGQGDAWGEESGGRGGQRIVYAGLVEPPEEVAGLLGEATAVERRRVITLDGRPVELISSFYPSAIAAGTALAEPGKIPGGAVTFLAELGHVGHRVREDVIARRATTAERAEFGVEEGEPVLVLTRSVFDAAERVIQVDVMVAPGAWRTLRYELRPGG
ncbi:hypothetical protein GCM10027589_09590 [Actinocorallia lasiicapitis]